jgi:hypothetical protein
VKTEDDLWRWVWDDEDVLVEDALQEVLDGSPPAAPQAATEAVGAEDVWDWVSSDDALIDLDPLGPVEQRVAAEEPVLAAAPEVAVPEAPAEPLPVPFWELPPEPEPVAELRLESVVEPVVKEVVQPEVVQPEVAPPALEWPAQATAEPVVAPESLADPLPETVPERLPEPLPEPVIDEPAYEALVEPLPEPVIHEPAYEALVEPLPDPVVEPAYEALVEPLPEPPVEPAPLPVPDPVIELQPVPPEAVAEPIAEPVVEPAIEPAAEPEAEPVVEYLEPVAEIAPVEEAPPAPPVEPPAPAVEPPAPAPIAAVVEAPAAPPAEVTPPQPLVRPTPAPTRAPVRPPVPRAEPRPVRTKATPTPTVPLLPFDAKTWGQRVAVFLAVAAVIAVVAPRVLPAIISPPPAPPGPPPEQLVVAWTVRLDEAPDHSLVAVMASGGKEPVAVAVPAELTVNVPGQGIGTIGQAASGGNAGLVGITLENTLGVRIDASLVTATSDLQAAIDGLGPIEVADQQITGAQAIEYLTNLDPGALPDEGFLRWQDVLDGIIRSAAARPEAVGAFPAELHPALQAGTPEDPADLYALPVVDLGAGLLRPDTEAVERLVRDRFILAGSNEVRFVVLNGVGTPGVGEDVARLLVPEGYRLMSSGNASTFDHRETKIIASSEEDIAAAERARELLGVGRVFQGFQPAGLADLTIVVGHDFASKPEPGGA